MRSDLPPLQPHPDYRHPPWMHPAVFMEVVIAIVALENWIR